jgi:hypothetical protein
LTGLVDDSGASTVEAALGITALVFVLVLCLAGVSAVSMQVRCVDAAREAARLAARGDERSAVDVARRVAPGGAQVQLRRDGEVFVAIVSVRPTLLPALVVAATGVSAAEPRR